MDNNTFPLEVEVIPPTGADLALTHTVSPGQVTVGGSAVFTLTVSNVEADTAGGPHHRVDHAGHGPCRLRGSDRIRMGVRFQRSHAGGHPRSGPGAPVGSLVRRRRDGAAPPVRPAHPATGLQPGRREPRERLRYGRSHHQRTPDAPGAQQARPHHRPGDWRPGYVRRRDRESCRGRLHRREGDGPTRSRIPPPRGQRHPRRPDHRPIQPSPPIP